MIVQTQKCAKNPRQCIEMIYAEYRLEDETLAMP